MGILIECPSCRTRGNVQRKVCKCGHNVQKTESKNYWVEYYDSGKEDVKESEEVKKLLKTDCVRSRLLKLKAGIYAKVKILR